MSRFSVASAAQSSKRIAGGVDPTMSAKVPKVCDINIRAVPACADATPPTGGPKRRVLPKLEAPPTLPKILQLRMGAPTQLIGFDIETHDWIEREQRYTKSRIGPFEWYTSQTEEDFDYSRIVQLGWAVGMAVEKADFVKSRLVQPDGFEVSKKATGFHHIKDDVARSQGEPLRSVLQEFLADVLDITARGGRVVAHHLEFDAGIILRELRRSRLDDLAQAWENIARRKGFCTMCPDIGRCILVACGEAIAHDTAKHNLGLLDSVRCLAPEVAANVEEPPKDGGDLPEGQRQLHDAGVDADLCRSLFLALRPRAARQEECTEQGGGLVCAASTNNSTEKEM